MTRVAGDIAIDVTADVGPLVTSMRKGTSSVQEFGRNAENVRRGLNRMGQTTRRFSSEMRNVTRSSGRFAHGMQNAAFQVGDFAVQVGGGTSAMRAMSMQLPQLLGGFGVFGAVAGAAVAIVGPLAQGLFDSADGASEAERALDGLSGTLGSIRGRVSELGDLQQRLNDLHRAQGGASAASASAVISNTQKEYDARRQLLEVERTLLRLRSQDAIQALNNLREQQDMARESMQERLRTLGPGSTANRNDGAEGFAGGGLRMDEIEGAIGEDSLDQMRERSRQMQRLEAELALVQIAADEASMALDGVFTSPGETEAGGSGGGATRLDYIREQLSAEEQAIAEHMDKIRQLTEGGLSGQLGAWEAYFKDLGNATGKGGEQVLRASKAIGAAQALVDAWKAHNATLADPTLPWFGRIAAAGSVLAAGIGAVNAINSVSVGGGGRGGAAGGGGATTTATPTQENATYLNFTFSGGLSSPEEIGRYMVERMNEAIENGATIKGVRAA